MYEVHVTWMDGIEEVFTVLDYHLMNGELILSFPDKPQLKIPSITVRCYTVEGAERAAGVPPFLSEKSSQ